MGLFESSIRLNGATRRIRAAADQSLLECLDQIAVHLPAACGGHGNCGLCLCRLPEGAGSPGEREKSWIDGPRQLAGWRLACQTAVRAGMPVEVPETALAARRWPMRVQGVSRLGPKLCRLALLPAGTGPLAGAPVFQPGQWARLEVALGGGREDRAFSFASAPGEPLTEFLVAWVAGGLVSSHIHDGLRPGDPLDLIGPFGDFGLPEPAACGPMLWIAGGSGLAPFVSLIRDGLARGWLGRQPVWLLFAVHRPEELFLHDWLSGIAAGLPSFHYLPSVSENPAGLPWEGGTGRLPQVLRRQLPGLFGAAGPAEVWRALLCGSAGLVEACRSVLRAAGLPDRAVFFDRFI